LGFRSVWNCEFWRLEVVNFGSVSLKCS
jgi:hypothetical protein